jgi:hypothetical protein
MHIFDPVQAYLDTMERQHNDFMIVITISTVIGDAYPIPLPNPDDNSKHVRVVLLAIM